MGSDLIINKTVGICYGVTELKYAVQAADEKKRYTGRFASVVVMVR